VKTGEAKMYAIFNPYDNYENIGFDFENLDSLT